MGKQPRRVTSSVGARERATHLRVGEARLENKIAIVTGAGSRGPGLGTGKAMAILFAREGARVCLVDAVSERAGETLEVIAAEGGDAFVVEADVALEADCVRIVAETIGRYGGIDVLINNVAINEGFGPLHELDEAVWNRVLSVNLTSAMLMCKHTIPAMSERGGGSIVNISSVAALVSTGGTEAYSASKAAMLRLTADLAIAYGRNGVRVNAVAPGGIDTPMVAGRSAVERDELRRMNPLGLVGDAWDVAWAATFLASDEARFVTAACIPVDGGLVELSPNKGHQLMSQP